MKKFEFFSLKLFFFIEVSLEKMKESICSFISLTLKIIDLKIILKELLSSTDLFGA